MAADTIQIVDDIKSSPTVLFDLNNENPCGVAEFDAPPPPLRYTTSSSMLADGSRISASSYENRTLNLGLDFLSTSQDNWASSWQTLARLLDQDRFWLKYQPTGATSPVFFNCWRSQVPQMQIVAGATAYRLPTLQIPADPAAYGLAEDISSFTITNDPTTGTNKMMVGPSVLGTIKGDLETPLLLAQTTGLGVTTTSVDDAASPDGPAYLASYALSGGNTHSFLARDLTELTSGTDVGATVSAAGTSYVGGNYKQWTPTSTNMETRLSGTFSTTFNPMPGIYRVLVRIVLQSGGTNQRTVEMRIGVSPTAGGNYVYGDTTSVTVVQKTAIAAGTLVDLGLVQFPVGASFGPVGLGVAATAGVAPDISIQASISSTATVTPRFDEIYFIPVQTTYGYGQIALIDIPLQGSANALVYDGLNDDFRSVYDASGTAPFSGVPVSMSNGGFIGGMPVVRPGSNNYLQYLFEDDPVGGTTAFTGRYYPRYLYVRPAST